MNCTHEAFRTTLFESGQAPRHTRDGGLNKGPGFGYYT